MTLTRQEIYHNYQECLTAVLDILETRYSYHGGHDKSITDLAQSVVGETAVVESLTTDYFDREKLYPLLIERIDSLRTEFLADLKKKQFVPLLDHTHQLIDVMEGDINSLHMDQAVETLQEKLSPVAYRILEKILKQNRRLIYIWGTHTESVDEIEEKLLLVKNFFPDLTFPDLKRMDISGQLEKHQIEDCYKCVYLGIETHFPHHFLNFEGTQRAAVLTRFLLEKMLNAKAESFVQKETIDIFIRYKLQNVARYFNHSLNRILANAYPDLILPWFNSRIPDNYWEKRANRVEAVRWLVEEVLGMDAENLIPSHIKRADFTQNGLSFLYNTYYNSVSKALGETYPFLHRWELGSVPYSYWNNQNAAKAIHWLIEKKGWKSDWIPDLIKTGHFTKKTFSEFGLATLFERKFNKNFFQAIDCAYPGRYMPWELGKVSSAYWQRPEHLFRAARWIAAREGIDEKTVLQAIRKKRITFRTFQKYSIGNALKRHSFGSLLNLFWPQFQEERNLFIRESRLLRKLNGLIEANTTRNKLLTYLFHGFFSGLHKSVNQSQLEQLKRIQSRMRRRQRYEA